MKTLSLSELCAISKQIAKQDSLTDNQIRKLNGSGFGKAILARWYLQHERFTLAIRKFLAAYEQGGQCHLKFEAAFTMLKWVDKQCKGKLELISYKAKRKMQMLEKQASELLVDAANGGNYPAAAGVFYMYMTSEQVQINRRILFLAIKASTKGYIDTRDVPEGPLFFSLIPNNNELKMLDKEFLTEVCRTLHRLERDQYVELSSSEKEILNGFLSSSCPAAVQTVQQLMLRTTALEKLLKIFDYEATADKAL